MAEGHQVETRCPEARICCSTEGSPLPVSLPVPPHGERGWSFLNEGRRSTPKPSSSLTESCARGQPEQHKRICCTALCKHAKSKPILRGIQYLRAVDWTWKFPSPNPPKVFNIILKSYLRKQSLSMVFIQEFACSCALFWSTPAVYFSHALETGYYYADFCYSNITAE